ncbi:MAG: UDP-N-acetylmuramoyl-L-alanyl-D-glutamate--2,6-diaminopimelate ligase [Elusimicrobia bacterium]|nr:UDP-N-acetylmuramoyl-L-alanyl-D-glutamate--2,6-diaminopimelate ligase [Elusimicrobiota bacterium]
MMRLGELVAAVAGAELRGSAEVQVEGLEFDSRRVRPGCAFVALRGEKTDGNRFIRQAAEAGAVAVFSELAPPPAPMELSGPRGTLAWVRVPDALAAMSEAAAAFYGDPSAAMTVVGVTGTNGKTTTTWLLESIASRAGKTPGVLGTTGHRLRHRALEEAANTTPPAADLLRLLGRMRDGGADFVAMEVSSHALALKRADGVRFDAAVLTNLHSDHLDFHGTREAYLEAKVRLFELLERPDGGKPRRAALLNRDDPAYDRFRRRIQAVPCAGFGLSPEADYRGEAVVLSQTGTLFTLKARGRALSVRLRLLGEHNVMNALAAASAALELGLPDQAVVEGLGALESVPGRLEPVSAGQPFAVLVDFAHTAQALDTVLAAISRLPHRRVITVFGCGGDRDRTKRAPMGRAAAEASDLVIATSDNPRGEEPVDILREVEAGLRSVGRENYRIVPDRREAIREALSVAQAGDVVLLAGKGHETTQTLRDRVVPFDDRQVAREALKDLGRA